MTGWENSGRVFVNSKFGVFYSNFVSLTPIVWKVSTEEHSKTTTFSGIHQFYSYFQNPSEDSCLDFFIAELLWR